VAPDRSPGQVDERARLWGQAVACEEVAIVGAGEKARLLALWPFGDAKTRRPSRAARLLLARVAEREPEPRDRRRIERSEHVALVLVLVGRTRKQQAPAMAPQTRVVTRREPCGADSIGEHEQVVEPKSPVARRTRVGRLAPRVPLDERRDHGPAKRLALIERDVRDPEPVTERPCLANGERGAARTLGAGPGRVEPESKRYADGLVPLGLHPEQSDGAVDPAAHGDRHPPGARRAPHGGTDRCSERVHRERRTADRRGFEEQQTGELAAELGNAWTLARRLLDPASRGLKTNPRPVIAGTGVSDELLAHPDKASSRSPRDQA
jgi:hypothetical protein